MSKILTYSWNAVKKSSICRAPTPSRTFSRSACHLLKMEPQDKYKPGGYHRVSREEVYNRSYQVLKQLGWGQYSTVWLVKDLRDNKLVAMKVMVGELATSKAKAHWDELDRLSTIQKTNPRAPGYGHICQLLDSFTVEGPNGAHTCLIMEEMSFSMSDVFRLSTDRGSAAAALPLPLVKRVCRHVLLALQYLHEECGIVHTDIKDDNILVGGLPQLDGDTNEEGAIVVTEAHLMAATFKLSDFGAANTMENRPARGHIIQPESLRAPEVIVGAEWDTSADIWNLGCLIYEFARGALLFDPDWDTKQSGMSPAQTHLAQITGLDVCGRDFPSGLLLGGTRSQHLFDTQGVLRKGAHRYEITLRELLMRPGHSSEDAEALSEFLSKMLVIHPKRRWTARQLLAHPWLSEINKH